jgi:glycine cleavage system aminomethyltransferase T
MRQAADRFLLITGSAQTVRDADWITRHIGEEAACGADRRVGDVFSVLSVMGPKARELLARVSPDDLSPEALKFSWTKRDRPGPCARARRAHELMWAGRALSCTPRLKWRATSTSR